MGRARKRVHLGLRPPRGETPLRFIWGLTVRCDIAHFITNKVICYFSAS